MSKIPVIAFMSATGGSAKTTNVFNIAEFLMEKSFKVLIIDLDSKNYTFLCSNINHVNLEFNVDINSLIQSVKSSDVSEYNISLLKYKFNEISSLFDIVLIDCPSGYMKMEIVAIAIATHYIVPIDTCSGYSIKNLVQLTNRVCHVSAKVNPSFEYLGVILNKMKKNDISYRIKYEIKALGSGFNDSLYADLKCTPASTILPVDIPDSILISEASFYHEAIVKYRPYSSAARSYKKLTEHLISKLLIKQKMNYYCSLRTQIN